jgi:hypothetical protein
MKILGFLLDDTSDTKMENREYSKLFSDYLVDCFMLNELDCQRRDSVELTNMVRELHDHWDEFQHYHKKLTSKELLVSDPYGTHMKFPTIVRGLGCNVAKTYAGNPMTGRSAKFIQSYVLAMMPKLEDKQ